MGLDTSNVKMMQDAAQRRLAWRCRRGMLELDIVLQRFVALQFATLTELELRQLEHLLDLSDYDIWTLINSKGLTHKNNPLETLMLKLKPALTF